MKRKTYRFTIQDPRSTNMSKNPLIRSIYLYLFALVGLGMLVVGTARLVNLGLKVYVFTKADHGYFYKPEPPYPTRYQGVEDVQTLIACGEKCGVNEKIKESLRMWQADYERWQRDQSQEPVDTRGAERQREAASALSLILVGLPLWLYHWWVIKKDKLNAQETV
ncbi:hypothetical protein HY629_00585 [Candidatus Uhrbacteria bacterium]|nr:hypothetical protein [Candidatus Uhrbacteria bacterium]